MASSVRCCFVLTPNITILPILTITILTPNITAAAHLECFCRPDSRSCRALFLSKPILTQARLGFLETGNKVFNEDDVIVIFDDLRRRIWPLPGEKCIFGLTHCHSGMPIMPLIAHSACCEEYLGPPPLLFPDPFFRKTLSCLYFTINMALPTMGGFSWLFEERVTAAHNLAHSHVRASIVSAMPPP